MTKNKGVQIDELIRAGKSRQEILDLGFAPSLVRRAFDRDVPDSRHALIEAALSGDEEAQVEVRRMFTFSRRWRDAAALHRPDANVLEWCKVHDDE